MAINYAFIRFFEEKPMTAFVALLRENGFIAKEEERQACFYRPLPEGQGFDFLPWTTVRAKRKFYMVEIFDHLGNLNPIVELAKLVTNQPKIEIGYDIFAEHPELKGFKFDSWLGDYNLCRGSLSGDEHMVCVSMIFCYPNDRLVRFKGSYTFEEEKETTDMGQSTRDRHVDEEFVLFFPSFPPDIMYPYTGQSY